MPRRSTLPPRPGARPDKGNRNEVEGKEFVGNYDLVVADGGRNRRYSPLWWRTYRYLELTVETQGEPLVIDDLHGIYTGYPFERTVADRHRLARRAADSRRRLAHGAPVRPRELHGLPVLRAAAVCGRHAHPGPRFALHGRRRAPHEERHRAPERLAHGGGRDDEPRADAAAAVHSAVLAVVDRDGARLLHVRGRPRVRARDAAGCARGAAVLRRHQKADGSLGPLPWWNYVDWTTEWRSGVPPRDADGSSAPLDLQLLLAYDWAARLETDLGSKAMAAEYAAAAARLRQTIRPRYWDEGRRLFADTPARKQFSQHANVLAVLAGVATGDEARDLMTRVLDDTVADAVLVLLPALPAHGGQHGRRGRPLSGPAGRVGVMLARGLTTFAERYEEPGNPTRSDCHAWSASPNFEIFRTVLGIDTAAPGFARVRVRPFLGKLERVSGSDSPSEGRGLGNARARGQRPAGGHHPACRRQRVILVARHRPPPRAGSEGLESPPRAPSRWGRRRSRDAPVIGARGQARADGRRPALQGLERQRAARSRTRTGASAPSARAADLVSKMTLDEKAGMMLIDSLNPAPGGVVARRRPRTTSATRR